MRKILTCGVNVRLIEVARETHKDRLPPPDIGSAVLGTLRPHLQENAFTEAAVTAGADDALAQLGIGMKALKEISRQLSR